VGWRRRRRLFDWEEEQLIDCARLLDNILLQDNVNDKWIWKHDLVEGYSVKGVYHIITATINKKILTKDNLIGRGVIPSYLILCLGGCRKEVTINHLFLG
jgi:hypothetical protein